MSRRVANLFACLTFPGSAVRLVHSNRNGGKRRSVHPRESNQFSVRVAHCDHACLSPLSSLAANRVDCSARFRVIDGAFGDHGSTISYAASRSPHLHALPSYLFGVPGRNKILTSLF